MLNGDMSPTIHVLTTKASKAHAHDLNQPQGSVILNWSQPPVQISNRCKSSHIDTFPLFSIYENALGDERLRTFSIGV